MIHERNDKGQNFSLNHVRFVNYCHKKFINIGPCCYFWVYDNKYTLIIDIYFYETFPTSNPWAFVL
jgi:hypothetical protein